MYTCSKRLLEPSVCLCGKNNDYSNNGNDPHNDAQNEAESAVIGLFPCFSKVACICQRACLKNINSNKGYVTTKCMIPFRNILETFYNCLCIYYCVTETNRIPSMCLFLTLIVAFLHKHSLHSSNEDLHMPFHNNVYYTSVFLFSD